MAECLVDHDPDDGRGALQHAVGFRHAVPVHRAQHRNGVRLQNAAPAHTELFIEYNSVPQFGALNDVTIERGDTHVLPEASGGDDR